ncbi:MAG: hypothetical protein KIH08_00090 [Candidatus Freyarchaeota archaeon]|nr:hypothetical protein [Candidatus Jordarchaeia archaeon]MBS7267295.1 hypothetical protein [Candidatus Jordarchaeia archaeon]MBS7278273.1 hypothetical protein [Candidatus Jordarchaeia archaeon]
MGGSCSDEKFIIQKREMVGTSDLSEFVMFEKAPYDLPDVRTSTEFLLKGIEEEAKIYGPVFTEKFVKYTLEFISQKIGEPPPEDIKTLNQLLEYLVSISDRYPTPYAAIPYSQPKTENDFHGQTGAGTTIEARSFAKGLKIEKNAGNEGREFNIDQLLKNIRDVATAIKFCPSEVGYKKNNDGSVDIVFPNCPYKDGCLQAYQENLLKRPDGRLRCVPIATVCQYLGMFTNYLWDYDRLEPLYEPFCISRIYII